MASASLPQFSAWIHELERRHLADLTPSEVARALRALSSAYVERRHTAIAAHRVLDGAGKRAAFALYFGPLHFLSATHVFESLGLRAPSGEGPTALPVIDLGCGTGAVGAAAAVATGATSVLGFETHPWALDEARRTFAAFGLDATLTRQSVSHLRRPRRPSFIVAGYVINELPDTERALLKDILMDAVRHGSRLLVIEPLSHAVTPWWPDWVNTFVPLGARADEWKLTLSPPDIVRKLGDAAGLTPTAASVKSLWVRPKGQEA